MSYLYLPRGISFFLVWQKILTISANCAISVHKWWRHSSMITYSAYLWQQNISEPQENSFYYVLHCTSSQWCERPLLSSGDSLQIMTHEPNQVALMFVTFTWPITMDRAGEHFLSSLSHIVTGRPQPGKYIINYQIISFPIISLLHLNFTST